MPNPTPYRTLPKEKRVALVKHMVTSNKDGRTLFIARLAAKTGFRPVTLQSWSADKLAQEVVRVRAETADDELSLLHLMYVELEPAIQSTFLDAAGVKHENGMMADELEAPFATEDAVKKGVDAVRTQHGEDGERYLRTLERYSAGGWPGIGAALGQ